MEIDWYGFSEGFSGDYRWFLIERWVDNLILVKEFESLGMKIDWVDNWVI